MQQIFRVLLMISFVFGLTSCQTEVFSFYVFSVSKEPVTVFVGEESKGTLELGKGLELKIPQKPDLQVRIQQGDTVLDSYQVGQSPLDSEGTEPVLHIVGGPASLILANYTDFYGEAPDKPEIRDVVSLREQKFHRLPADAMLAFPSPTFPREMVEGKQMWRMVSVPPHVSEDKFTPFLYFELKQLK